MSRRTVLCKEKHTPLSPIKNGIRLGWMSGLDKSKDIITISHGLLDMAMAVSWKGRIQVCDTDAGVRETVRYLKDDYPNLNILPPLGPIRECVSIYGNHNHQRNGKPGFNCLAAVDVDLACGVRLAWHILEPVLAILVEGSYKGKTLLTFCQRDRDFGGEYGTWDRIDFLRSQLKQFPTVSLTNYKQYSSIKIADNCKRSKGSAMCIVELSHKKSLTRKLP